MELQYSLSITIFFLIIFSLYYSLISTTKSQKLQKLPPGPMKLPIIGNLHNLIGPLPHHTLRRLSRKYGPLMHLTLGEVPTLVVSCPETARKFMTTKDLSFAQRPHLLAVEIGLGGSRDIAFAPYGEYWRQMKKICMIQLLSSKRVQSFSSIREDEARNFVKTIRSSSSTSSPINLKVRLFELTSTIICRAAFGRKYDNKDASSMVSATQEATLVAGGFDLVDLYPSKKLLRLMSRNRAKLEKLYKKGDEALQNIVNNHLSEMHGTKESGEGETETEDLVDVLLKIQRSDSLDVPFTITDVKSIIVDMFAGGTDTAAITTEFAMAEMMKNPRIMEKAQGEIRQVLKGKKTIYEKDIQSLTYLKLVIKETLRLHPPVPLLLPRECRESCVIDGYEIPTKTRVLINAWAIARDPKYWDDAESFVPERFINSSVDHKGTNFEYIPFGAGRRICPGMSFGLTNVEIVLSHLLYHFDWSLPDKMKPEDLDMTEIFGATIGRKQPLCLIASPFTPVEE